MTQRIEATVTRSPEVLTVQPLGGHLGARVLGLDLRHALDRELAEHLHAVLDEHLVLVFPDQHLDDAQQFGFARAFGGPYIHPLGRGAGREAGCERIIDDVEHPPYQDKWHTDVSWDPEPPTVGTLRAIDMPERGGDTVFASMYAAYDSLSPTMQAAIEPLVALHTMGAAKAFISKAGADAVAKAKALFPGTERPVVGVHSRTGRKFLNVNREFTERIVGMTDTESNALLHLLTETAVSPNWQFRYQWSVGDVVLWDEQATQHFAVADYLPARREMGRAVVRATTV